MHRLKPSTLHGHREKLSPVIAELGHLEVQNLTKRQVDDLVSALRAGGLRSPTQKVRKAWSPRSVNYTLSLLTAVLKDQQKQGNLVRNVVSLVDRVPGDPKPSATLTEDEVEAIEEHTADDRYRIAWQLALAGLRRGEIAGLRWEDVDLRAKTVTIARNLVVALKATKKFQAADRLALGTGYQPSGYVVVNEAGAPLSPGAISSRWEHVLEGAGVRKVRLHDARHTCGTLMHLKGVPIAVVAAWFGHASSAFTQAVYTHSQPDAMTAAAQSFTRVVTNRDNSGSW
jgi:integrase